MKRRICMYECFHCGCKAVIWDCDYDYSDYGIYEEEGIVHVCHCENCGAMIEYYVPVKKESEDDD